MIELTIRVEQSNITLQEAERELKIANLVDVEEGHDFANKRKRLDSLVVLLRIITVLICLVILSYAIISNTMTGIHGRKSGKLVVERMNLGFK